MTGEELSSIVKPYGFVRQTGVCSRTYQRRSFALLATVGLPVRTHPRRSPVHVDLGLLRSAAEATIGTQHRFISVAALARDVTAVLAEIESLIQHPDLLKCLDSGRWVVLKEPTRGQNFAPFGAGGARCAAVYLDNEPHRRREEVRDVAVAEHDLALECDAERAAAQCLSQRRFRCRGRVEHVARTADEQVGTSLTVLFLTAHGASGARRAPSAAHPPQAP